MKKYICFALMAVALCLTGCKKKTPTQSVMDFRSTITKEDTVQMLKLSDQCMDLLKAKKMNDAFAMLYEYDEEKKDVVPLSSDTRKRLERQLRMFPVLDYQRVYFSFLLEGVNDVKYRIKFAEEEHPEVNGEAVTAFMLNPVRVNGTWYLTVKNSDQFDRFQN